MLRGIELSFSLMAMHEETRSSFIGIEACNEAGNSFVEAGTLQCLKMFAWADELRASTDVTSFDTDN
jgi:hypothetical protein